MTSADATSPCEPTPPTARERASPAMLGPSVGLLNEAVCHPVGILIVLVALAAATVLLLGERLSWLPGAGTAAYWLSALGATAVLFLGQVIRLALRDAPPWARPSAAAGGAARARPEVDALRAKAGHWQAVGDARLLAGREDDARDAYRRALEGYEALGERWSAAGVLRRLGHLEKDRGRLDDSCRALEDARACYRDAGDRYGEASVLLDLGAVERRRGADAAAAEAYAEARRLLADIVRTLGAHETDGAGRRSTAAGPREPAAVRAPAPA